MPLPPTRYIDAGPGVPLANPNVAMAPGEAMARVGKSIQDVGDVGVKIGEQLRRIDDNRKMTSLFTAMEQETADFEMGLMKREDTDNWKQEYSEKSAAWKTAAGESKMSPEGQAVFDARFAEWNTRKQIGFQAVAANKSIELARAASANAYDFHMSRRDYGAAQQVVDDMHRSGFSSAPDREKAMMVIEQAARHDGIMDNINADARKWMADNPADKPPRDYDAAKWRQIQDYAAGIARDKDVAASDDVLNRVVTGNVTSRKEIDALTPKMTPLQRQKLYDASDRWNAEGAKARREDPATISGNVGKFYATLSDWKPDEEGQDPAGVELRMLIEELPEGHPLRDKMRDSMAARKSRIGEEVKTKADQGRESLKLASERGDFGPVKPPVAPNIETRAAVKDGYLKDIPKLQSLGFSEAQAEDIREVAAQDPALGQKKFTELWKDRPQQSANATPFDIAVSDALRLENGEVQWKADLAPEVMAAHETATRAYGEAVIDFEKWIKLNPDADDKAIGGKLRELGRKSERVAPVTGPVKAPPGRIDASTSMNTPVRNYPVGTDNVVTPETERMVQANARNYLKDPDTDLTKAPLGMRNNNPTNIVYPSEKVARRFGAIGKSTNQDSGSTDGKGGKYSQMVFATPEDGMKAGARLARSKYDSGMTTATELITASNGWTPGNHEAAANIARGMGIGPNDDLNLDDPASMTLFLKALVLQEHGKAGKLYKDSLFSQSNS